MSSRPPAGEAGSELPGRGAADACPGALRLHAADDGHLARVRIPGGLLTDRQALVLADAAAELGDGQLETTSRGNVQLRGLAADSGLELGRRLRAAGLLPSDTHERVRNIVASPGAGLDGLGFADVQGWVRELDAALCASDVAAGLSGKFLFALDDGRGDVAALDADVTLIAVAGGGALLRLGRARTARVVPAGGEVAAALAAAVEFLGVADGAWHVREVSSLALGREPIPGFGGRPVGVGLLPGAGRLSAGSAQFPAPLGSATESLCVGLPFGRVTVAQWRLMASVGRELRVTPWRSVVLPGVGAEVLAELGAAGLRVSGESAWAGASACTGAPGCGKSVADVRRDAAAALDGMAAGGLPVHWSGCERRCGHPSGVWVDVLATGPEGYRVAGGASFVDVTREEMAAAVAEARRTK
ncbi:precorrin-3B synthase [Kitasatospora sp. MMS16-BH015]|uniref:precorrin-3B synthase n=1 Tax=Kitasatospora sp. MMS16-BH015 TaxID=2018025 RepID=UPI0020C3202B|nr:precorrin-3B synthase [Kitasatospora sp. MMS16-BH015]